MRRLIWSQLRHRPGRAVTLGFGILVAAVSFTLLTAAVRTSTLEVTGVVTGNFKSAYDILVRPPDSLTEIEVERGLVAPNYLSGIYGGITMNQWHEILRLPGVEVAAPIANIGYILPFGNFPVDMGDLVNGDPVQLYRLHPMWIANGGASRYPDADQYVYYTTQNRLVDQKGTPAELVPGRSSPAPVCRKWVNSVPHFSRGPFDLRWRSNLTCFSSLSPEIAPLNRIDERVLNPGDVAGFFFPQFAVLLSAIDPAQEERLVGLRRTVVSGRMFQEAESAKVRVVSNSGLSHRIVPVLASEKTFVDQDLRFQVERLRASDGDVLDALASNHAYQFVSSLKGPVIGTKTFSAQEIYDRILAQNGGEPFLDAYWRASAGQYASRDEILFPQTVRNPASTWRLPSIPEGYAPTANRDVQFRRLAPRVGSTTFMENVLPVAKIHSVGRFDPTKLPGFSPLTRVPLETYSPPEVQPANSDSANALGDRPLLPTLNIGGYVQQPPLMLTTLQAAAEAFASPKYYDPEEPSPSTDRAPISAIRVRVAGVTGPDPLSRERVRRVAEAIEQRTGLAVDVTAGSSPHPLLVRLPPGKFGQPSLLVSEGWAQKGVAFRIADALDRKSLALFVLVLVVSALFLANGAFASVRSRRTEIGTLLCLGWGRGRIFRAVLGELALVGAVAGVVGTALAFGLVKALSLDLSPPRTLLVAPVAVALACLAGLVPAWRAARSVPLDAVRPSVAEPRRARPIRGVARMAAANLLRLPGRTLLGAGALLVGVAALAFLLSVNLAFRGTLVGTLLGEVISVQVRGVDYLSVALAIALGGLSVADVLFLNLKERAPELVTLRTTGWRESHLARLVVMEGVGIGVVGAVLGAVIGLVLAVAVGGPAGKIAQAALFAALAGVAVAALASVIPAVLTSGLTPPTVLAEE